MGLMESNIAIMEEKLDALIDVCVIFQREIRKEMRPMIILDTPHTRFLSMR